MDVLFRVSTFREKFKKNYDRRNPLFSSFSQLSDTTSHFFSGWKRVCTMYNFASFPFLLKNDWYHFFLPCKCFMPFSKKIENGSDVQGKLLRNKKLLLFTSLVLCCVDIGQFRKLNRLVLRFEPAQACKNCFEVNHVEPFQDHFN